MAHLFRKQSSQSALSIDKIAMSKLLFNPRLLNDLFEIDITKSKSKKGHNSLKG